MDSKSANTENGQYRGCIHFDEAGVAIVSFSYVAGSAMYLGATFRTVGAGRKGYFLPVTQFLCDEQLQRDNLL